MKANVPKADFTIFSYCSHPVLNLNCDGILAQSQLKMFIESTVEYIRDSERAMTLLKKFETLSDYLHKGRLVSCHV